MPEGSILYLPRVVLQRMESKESEKEVASLQEGRKVTLSRKVYEPTRDDIEWARELVLHMVFVYSSFICFISLSCGYTFVNP